MYYAMILGDDSETRLFENPTADYVATFCIGYTNDALANGGVLEALGVFDESDSMVYPMLIIYAGMRYHL